MSYITLTLPFNVGGSVAGDLFSTAWLFKTATHRMLSLAKQTPILPATDIGWKNTFRKAIYEVIPNRRYVDGVITLVRGIYESCRQLGVGFKEVELGDWLMFQQAEKEYPVRNITLKDDYSFYITTIGYNGEKDRIVVKPTIPKNYKVLLDKILEERQKHTARIVIKDYGVRKNRLWVHGEIQLTIPIDFYYKHMTRYRRNYGKLYGGVDVNVDRANLAVVDRYGRLRHVKTFWFEEASRKGCRSRRARSIIGMTVHDMLKYAYHHGVKTLFLENPDVLGKLKLLWIRNGKRLHRNYNWRVSVFRSRIIEMITMKTPLYAIRVEYVDPRRTTHSEEHDKIMKRYGLDRHSTSAYLIALRGIERYSSIQKVTA
ncbi:hypothetical protein APE_1276 [Aeropyrum pernix K1]|uniref:Uncharacterized protein APE_1276 n=1 Tax=Aeropyrum pernix (strain ATCC 700893 / DSM 11879 / JCM 9820 / NBRC 100138 / K1) TaxID=272557 RepID=Y1276_AERPE|nr:hypothetical protein [Aeropyrum pernix]P56816.1 RecName: Full=Uncharacterized protein APE_1276 [Aeropyrum pernix K1]BAA80267.1 hypothetical protein APE_1276 [Aeropyrum pernix K1]